MIRITLKIFHFLLLLAFFIPGKSQDTIRGTVKDVRSGTELGGANILLPDLKLGTSSNASGKFTIPGRFGEAVVLRISYIGYQDTTIGIERFQFGNMEVFLQPDSIEMASVIVTATRLPQEMENIPQRIDRIDQAVIEGFPATNTDNLLRIVPGVNVNRSWGIFSRNASVTMRGMSGSTRSLILLDGIPLNKTAGGTVSWHLVMPEEIERIEVVKGPGSTIYGNNAMGGVINIITKHPRNSLDGFANLGYGTYNTLKGQLNLSGKRISEGKGLYWKMGGFYRQGDGYMLEPGETRDSINTDAYLQEGNAYGLLGYQFSSNSRIEVDYRFYEDKRGAGIKVYEEDGSYESFTNNNLRFNYEGLTGKYRINAKAFYLREGYYRQNENVNNSGEFKLVDTETVKQDAGIWVTASRSVATIHTFTAGFDIKNGTLENHEIYRTSTDDIATYGKLLFSGIFIQDELVPGKGKFRVVAGVRFDMARYYDGRLRVEDPTSKTGFPGDMEESFPASTWYQLSPKVAFNYQVHPGLRTFLSASTGFMPPRLDDLAGSRKIRRGFKIANPDLQPETLYSFEWGLDWTALQKLKVEPSVFYSRGSDFQYLVASGDFIDSGSEDPVPVYQRQNVSNVEVAGLELGLVYPFTQHLSVKGAYTYNYSKILDYESTDEADLTGKELNEVPPNIVYVGFTWQNKIVNVYIDYSFIDEQWFDEENTEKIEGYSIANVRLSKNFLGNFQAALDIQDLFDVQFIDRKGYLSPGRFIMVELGYRIGSKR